MTSSLTVARAPVRIAFALIAAAAGLLLGCEASVAPILSTERAFTMYGTLSSSADTQTVRVYRIGQRLEPTPGQQLGATFTSEDLETGTVRTWNDSVHTEPDGQRVHVFWAPFSVDQGSRYRLKVADERDTSSAELTVPPHVEPEGEAPKIAPGSVVKRIRVPAEAPEVASPVTVIYTIRFDAASPQQGVPEAATYAQPELEVPVEKDGDTWLIEIPLDQHFEVMDARFADRRRIDPNWGIYLFGMELRLQIVNEGWTVPGRELTPDLVVEPGVRTNVVNGFGFVGAGYTQTTYIPVSTETKVEAGFRSPPP